MKQEDLLKRLKEHKPITVNYGKGYFTNQDILDEAEWDEATGKYIDSTGIWDTALLVEISQGKVEDTTLEVPNGI